MCADLEPKPCTPLHGPSAWEQVGLEPERASLREPSQLPVICRKNWFRINFNFKTCFEDKVSCGSMYWNRRITLGSNAFFHKWNNQSPKDFHCKELKAHYLLSQFEMLCPCLLAVPHFLPQKNTVIFLVFVVLRIILQLPLWTDGRFVSAGFTKHVICTCCSWDKFAHPFFQPSL